MSKKLSLAKSNYRKFRDKPKKYNNGENDHKKEVIKLL